VAIPLFQTRLSPEAIQAAVGVLESGWLGQGARVGEFEAAFGEYVGADNCIAVATGTAAIHMALRVLDLEPGSEIITTPQTWVSTHYAIEYVGCVPVLADIDPATGNIDPQEIERRITDRTGAIVVVHYCGYACDLDEILAIADAHGLPVVEDAAHAVGSTYRGRPVGSGATLQCFSFGPIKNLPMVHGGAITSSDATHFQRLRALRSMGLARSSHERLLTQSSSYRPSYELTETGFRYELPDVHAAIGLAQLPHVAGENAARRRVADAYREAFADTPGVRTLDYADDRESACHMYPILVDDRDSVAGELGRRAIDVGVHYPANPLLSHDDVPKALSFAEQVLTLPIHPWLTDDEIGAVIEGVRAA
jgi:dTDP-4-amino-4,6-dideoxygalactose transaminase